MCKNKKNLPWARCSYGKRGKYVVAKIGRNFHISKFFAEKTGKQVLLCQKYEKNMHKMKIYWQFLLAFQKKCLYLQRHNLINGCVLHKEKRHECFVYWLVET